MPVSLGVITEEAQLVPAPQDGQKAQEGTWGLPSAPRDDSCPCLFAVEQLLFIWLFARLFCA